jgi:hypothetical protein
LSKNSLPFNSFSAKRVNLTFIWSKTHYSTLSFNCIKTDCPYFHI